MSQSSSLKDPSALACTPIPDQPSDLPRPAHHWDPLDRHYRSHCPEASKHTFLRYCWQTSIQKRQKIIQKYGDISQEFWGCGSPQKPEILTWNPHHLSHTHTTKALRENRRFKSYRLLTGLWDMPYWVSGMILRSKCWLHLRRSEFWIKTLRS